MNKDLVDSIRELMPKPPFSFLEEIRENLYGVQHEQVIHRIILDEVFNVPPFDPFYDHLTQLIIDDIWFMAQVITLGVYRRLGLTPLPGHWERKNFPNPLLTWMVRTPGYPNYIDHLNSKRALFGDGGKRFRQRLQGLEARHSSQDVSLMGGQNSRLVSFITAKADDCLCKGQILASVRLPQEIGLRAYYDSVRSLANEVDTEIYFTKTEVPGEHFEYHIPKRRLEDEGYLGGLRFPYTPPIEGELVDKGVEVRIIPENEREPIFNPKMPGRLAITVEGRRYQKLVGGVTHTADGRYINDDGTVGEKEDDNSGN